MVTFIKIYRLYIDIYTHTYINMSDLDMCMCTHDNASPENMSTYD